MSNIVNESKKNWKPYNDQPLEADETLVPQMVTEDYARSLGANMGNLRTWHKGGVSYTVMFVPVKKSKEAVAMETFNTVVNEYLDEKLGPNRFSRCLVPQPNGTKKPCPKKNGDNHECCAECPHRNEYEKEDKSVVYLSRLDEFEMAAGSTPSAEDEVMVNTLLKELLEELNTRNPKLAKVVMLGYAGYEKKEILGMLDVKQSMAYNLYNEAKRLTEAFLLG